MGENQRGWTTLFGKNDLEDWQIVLIDKKNGRNKANCKIKITTSPFEYAGEDMPAEHVWS